jgi:predicted house-cleaning noncanonical NTP pyrophosphatase (MazG superfamily)
MSFPIVLLRNKLVRDRVPWLRGLDGYTTKTRLLYNSQEIALRLSLKLNEELYEFNNAQSREEEIFEIADLIEVMWAIKKYCPNIENVKIDCVRQILKRHTASLVHRKLIHEAVRQKRIEKGGFRDLIFIVSETHPKAKALN